MTDFLTDHGVIVALLCAAAAVAYGVVVTQRLLALSHCVLTHHGPEAATGRRLGSPEALALQRLNALDAAVKGALEHGLGLDG